MRTHRQHSHNKRGSSLKLVIIGGSALAIALVVLVWWVQTFVQLSHKPGSHIVHVPPTHTVDAHDHVATVVPIADVGKGLLPPPPSSTHTTVTQQPPTSPTTTTTPTAIVVSPQSTTQLDPKPDADDHDAAVGVTRKERADLKVIVMTYNRAHSTLRLLKSIANANYPTNVRIDLMVSIDRPKDPNKAHDADTVRIADEFEWKLGQKTVVKQPENLGIYGQWIDTWQPTPEDDDERVLLLEDDLELSPWYYKWLSNAMDKYSSYPEVVGFSLQKQKLRAKDIGVGEFLPPTHTRVFMYRLVGTWGYAPVAAKWRKFRQWFHEHKSKPDFHPYVEGLTPTNWYKQFERDGFAHSMWSMWFIRFCDDFTMYTVYATPKDFKALAVHHAEKGLHYSGGAHTEAQEASVRRGMCVSWTDELLDFPEIPKHMGWNGNPESYHAVKALQDNDSGDGDANDDTSSSADLENVRSGEYGRIGVFAFCDAGCMKRYGNAVSSARCYARNHGYAWFLDEETLIPNMHATWSKLIHARRRLKQVDWLLVLDADNVIANWSKTIEEYIDPAYHVSLIERMHNGEIMGASYLLKNSPTALDFMKQWAQYSDGSKGIMNNDNGCVHHLVYNMLTMPNGASNCNQHWKGDYRSFFGCVKSAMANKRAWPDHKFRIFRILMGPVRCMEELRSDIEADQGPVNIYNRWIGNELFVHTKQPQLYFPEPHVCTGQESGYVRPDFLLKGQEAHDKMVRGVAWWRFPSTAATVADCFPNCPLDIQWRSDWQQKCRKCCRLPDGEEKCTSWMDRTFSQNCWDRWSGREYFVKDDCYDH
jgi:Protein of unknown function, DUF273